MDKIELLAPAGSLSILKAAVDAGADAVYCGINAFNARINAANFTLEDLQEGCEYAHLRSSKVYLTLNTLVNDYELNEAVSTAAAAYEAGVDAILVQDIGLATEISRKFPAINLHVSTQMNAFSADEMKQLSDIGFKRVVLPRELTLDEIHNRARIAARYKMDVEVFAHGAVCVCYSGLCLFSSMNKSGTRSGNRGLCAQPCREEYKIMNDGLKLKSGHVLSPKDRDVIEYIESLIDAGVKCLKIEGRMRDVNYVVSAVSAYRKIIDAFYAGELDSDLKKSVTNDLLVNFNRGGAFTTQNLNGKKPDNLLSGEHPGKHGLLLGRIITTDSKKGTVTFSYSEDLPLPAKGDFLSVRKDNEEICSFPIGKIHEAKTSLAVKGLHPEQILKLSRGLNVYLMSHPTVIAKSDMRKTPINISVNIENDVISLNAVVVDGFNSGSYGEYEDDIPMDFNGSPLSRERIIAQLRKTGDTPYVVNEVYFVTEDDIKCPISLINELRRGVLDSLSSDINEKYSRFVMSDIEVPEITIPSDSVGTDSILFNYPCYRESSVDLEPGADIYSFSMFDLAIKNKRDKIVAFVKKCNSKLIMVLPDMFHDRFNKIITNVIDNLQKELGDSFIGILDSKILADDYLKEFNIKHFVSGGANLFNSKSLKYASEHSDGYMISYELSPDETLDVITKVSLDTTKPIIVHREGDIRWMQTDHCPIGNNMKNCNKCRDVNVFDFLQRDEGEKKLKVITHNMDCSSMIYGPSKFTFTEDHVERINDAGFDTISVYTKM